LAEMSTLEELLAEMSTLEDQIKDVEGEIKACSDPEERKQLRKKEEQLREKLAWKEQKELILLRSQQAAAVDHGARAAEFKTLLKAVEAVRRNWKLKLSTSAKSCLISRPMFVSSL